MRQINKQFVISITEFTAASVGLVDCRSSGIERKPVVDSGSRLSAYHVRLRHGKAILPSLHKEPVIHTTPGALISAKSYERRRSCEPVPNVHGKQASSLSFVNCEHSAIESHIGGVFVIAIRAHNQVYAAALSRINYSTCYAPMRHERNGKM